jgi:ribosomal protein S18 acetylase RimI-like enzyme
VHTVLVQDLTPGSHPKLLRRLVEFELDRQRRSSERVEELDWGRLILNSPTSALWSDNFLELDAPQIDAHRLVRLAEELLGGNGIEHRYIVPSDPAYGDQLAPRFRELGWELNRFLYMVFARETGHEAGAAREVPRRAIEPVRFAVAQANPDFTREAIDQRPIRDARLDAVANGRWFAAPVDGEPVAACVLYESDGIGQVETVGTKPEARGRGLASAVVMAAVDASLRAGHGLTFIVADAEDWPWRLYERLGFERLGVASAFLRKPRQLRC